jgi:uncharacterized RDD family membrane protein YckC
MPLQRLIPAAAACIGALAIAAPVASAADNPLPGAIAGPGYNPVCMQVALEGPYAVLGPYGVLGDYGPLGSKAGQQNPAAGCDSGSGFGAPGFGAPGLP